MNDSELECLLNDLESDRVERKAALSDPDRIRQAICAFANDLPGHGKPGVIFIGVHDNGASSGLSITDELLRKLADMRGDGNIQPLPSVVVEKRPIRNAEIAVVTDYRNPHLAEAMRTLGYIQRFGLGILIARAELMKNNNPAPQFIIEPSHVLVVVRRKA